MIFNRHSEWQDKHAILSASKYHWLRYTDERMHEYVDSLGAARRGTKQHELAKRCIELRQKLPNTNQTLNAYVNDAIGFRMEPEQILFYSPYAFGTADAISFRRDPDGNMVLRIFDLKNGKTKASEDQLLVYAAYFCLEYKQKPANLLFDLRIYQHDEIYYIDVDPVEVVYVMDRIQELNELVTTRMNEEV